MTESRQPRDDGPDDEKSKSEFSGEEELVQVLAGLDAGKDLETLVSQWPELAESLLRRVNKLQGIGLNLTSSESPPSIPGFDLVRMLGRGG